MSEWEKSIRTRIKNRLNELANCKCKVSKGSVENEAGDPDLYGCYRSFMFVLEVKNSVGELSEIQKVRLHQWKKAGAIVGVVRTVEEAVEVVSGMRSNWSAS